MWVDSVKIFSGLVCLVTGLSVASLAARPALDNLSIEPVTPGKIIKVPLSIQGDVPGRDGSQELPLYLIRLEDPPAASYRGNIAGLRATSPKITGETRYDPRSPDARAYRQYLVERHAELERRMSQALDRPVKAVYQYFNANNGIAARLTPKEAEIIRRLPGVSFIQADFKRQLHTDAGPTWIGAPPIWNGTGITATRGEGIVIGVIDSGINPSNDSFAAVGPVDGYQHVNPLEPPTYLGVCDPSNTSPPAGISPYDPTFPCNEKLIGVWGYNDVSGGNPVDDNGHGSHTASTAAGNHVNAVISAPDYTESIPISGVAPHANIIAYDACGEDGSCPGSVLGLAIDQAVADGVDVVNYSIGSQSYDPWNDWDSLGFLNAREAGIFVATSAGNSGPGSGTIGSPADAPWLLSVGNSTHDRVFINSLVDLSGGTTNPADMEGKGLTSGAGPAPIIHAADLGDAQCLVPFVAGECDGLIVVCDRGDISRVEKGANVAACGAAGFVLANEERHGESTNADPHVLPAVHLGYQNSELLRNWISDNPGATMASISGASRIIDPARADIMAANSSRGPNPSVPGIIKPDITAPGTDIFAALGTGDPSPDQWGFLSGTSMASPHAAGSAALLRTLHPDWTVAEIQSAITSTGRLAVRKNDEITPADPFDMGGGGLAVDKAASATLVLHEDDFASANPATGGDPTTLNLATLGNDACLGSCGWTRSITNTGTSGTVDVSVGVRQLSGWQVTVTPENFTLMPGGSQNIEVMATAVSFEPRTWSFGGITLTPSAGPVQGLPLALAFDPPVGTIGSYFVTSSETDPNCTMPLANSGAYLDFEAYGIYANSSVVGESVGWYIFTDFPVNYYGMDYPYMFITDDGLSIFSPETNYAGPAEVPQFIPDVTLPNAVAAPLWANHEIFYDQLANQGVTIASLNTNDIPVAQILEFDDLEPMGGGTPRGDFEFIHYFDVDDSPNAWEIIFAYDNLGNLPAISTIGVEDHQGAEAAAFLNFANPASVISNGLAVCFDLAGCRDYWLLDQYPLNSQKTVDARKAIVAGGDFNVGVGGNLELNTAPGGFVSFFPGFGVAGSAGLSVNTNAAVCQ